MVRATQAIYPMNWLPRVSRGKTSECVPTYCQPMAQLKNPIPSLPLAPPKRYVNDSLCWFARQKIEIPVVKGAIYSGTISQTILNVKTYQKTRKRFFARALSRCRDRKRDAKGSSTGHNILVR